MRNFQLRPGRKASSALALAGSLLAFGATAHTAAAVPIPAPVITEVSPNTGFAAGSDLVFISGTGVTAATSVTIDGQPVEFVDELDGTISFFTPPHALGTVDVAVTSAGGTSANTSADDFTYIPTPPVPVVTSISPSSGPLAGGTVVTIKGTGLTNSLGVVFGQFSLGDNVEQVSDTEIRVTTPAMGTVGTYDVIVLTAGGASIATGTADDFTYGPVVLLPTITSVTGTGRAGVGGVLKITGTNFTRIKSVKIGPKNAKSFSVKGGVIQAVAPALPKGTYPVTVVSNVGSSLPSPVATYTYLR